MVYFLIFISAIFVNNIVLSQFLGICPFLGVSKKINTAMGMGAAVTFVLTLATVVTYLLQKLLVVCELEFLQTILFILIIAALVQMIEIMLKKVSPALYQALGVFLPLITTNCCILGVAILVANGTYKLPAVEGAAVEPGLLSGTIFAFATAIGFAVALVLFAGLREQLALNKVPKAMQGTPIALLTAGLLAMAFMGFSGVV
ncbi:MAG: RnfABCDGE type electron transport complex subunit A [Paludibacteraceae bacterium]|jgi:electron transport complex protein RnfA|nr:RnfABCDGE type electron transport complex subunit A [Paludibacteraceae bacterium]MEE0923697.1 RnfABCDGE type electron transport complex subunit A [Paludibacteraceae bacterium]MEE0951212.1 RnfABCDGE type electron transport complex subunit A [Paludibacteraceae bacterium]MEE1069352.1 RnfABCDGE type electron transport complex subunit A [Paludibacteraceae bacterium]MEE1095678.1 RnfABCDGE type electron transport complex subunit A [Paludibacteraceae bacterium]